MSSRTYRVQDGLGFCGSLSLLFLALKLLGYISWSWVWVTAPLWVPASIVCVVFLAVVASATLLHLLGDD